MDDNPKFLIIRFSSIGDIILSTPIPEWLKKQYPECTVHFLTLSNFSPLLECNPFIDKLIHIKRQRGFKLIKNLANLVSDSHYDLVVDLHNSLRSKYIRRHLKGVKSVIYKKPRWKRFILFYFHINRFDKNYNISSEYLKMVDSGANSEERLTPKIYISAQEKERAGKFLKLNGSVGEFIAITPGAAWPNKIWNVDGYIDIIKKINKGMNSDIILLGGKNDTVCNLISDSCPKVINLKGKCDLRMSLAILSLAKLAFGSDTGMIHGAEAVGKPVIMIKGPTSKATGASVSLSNSKEVKSDQWCRPCSKNGSRTCYRKEQYCMTTITSDIVLEKMRNQLALS